MNNIFSKEDIRIYNHKKKPLWNITAISYTLISYITGLALILLSNIWLNFLGVLILTHSFVISAYLAHEFMHDTIFSNRQFNTIGGNLMLWLNGSCYARFRDLSKHHVAHHIKRVDFASSNLLILLNDLPRILRGFILILEWLYFPAIDFIVKWKAIFNPFWNYERRDERLRIIILLLIRALLFCLLGVLSLKALLLYFFAYIGMLTVLRVVDAFHHTYEVFLLGMPIPKHNFTYEQKNTFSTLISQRYWWLNLLLLNFGYHNAHHTLMKCPWHSLHELNKKLCLHQKAHYISLMQAIVNYHRFRISRILLGGGVAVDEQGKLQMNTFYGGVGISFLVLPHT